MAEAKVTVEDVTYEGTHGTVMILVKPAQTGIDKDGA